MCQKFMIFGSLYRVRFEVPGNGLSLPVKANEVLVLYVGNLDMSLRHVDVTLLSFQGIMKHGLFWSCMHEIVH